MGNLYCIHCEKNKLSLVKKLIVSIYLCLFFVIVYSTCNNISATRSDIGVLYFQWEDYIPLIPWMIIPYMSIDIFYFFSPFLCRSNNELKVFAQRIILGTVIAGVFFLLMPLTLSKARPEVTGLFRPIFKFLHGFDKTYNLFPSMHIILRTILAHKYFQRSRGLTRFAVFIWFSLIGFSTVFTYQHHVIDVIGGFVVALAVFYIIPGEKMRGMPVIKNYGVSSIYIVLTLICYLLAVSFQGWCFFFLYPAISTFITAMAYLGIGPGITRKTNGVIAFPSRVVLLPYFIGQILSRWYYLRKTNLYDEVTDSILIGAVLSSRDAEKLVKSGVVGVLDMTAEFSENRPFRTINYMNLQVMDLTEPPQDYLARAADFIADNLQHGKVYVHCKIGFSRSVAAVAAYLVKYSIVDSYQDAFAMIRKSRPAVVIRKEIVTALKKYESNLASKRGE